MTLDWGGTLQPGWSIRSRVQGAAVYIKARYAYSRSPAQLLSAELKEDLENPHIVLYPVYR